MVVNVSARNVKVGVKVNEDICVDMKDECHHRYTHIRDLPQRIQGVCAVCHECVPSYCVVAKRTDKTARECIFCLLDLFIIFSRFLVCQKKNYTD